MSLLDPSLTFSDLATSVGLDVRLKKAVARMGLIRPTLVQSKCLPLAISEGKDLLVRARTGSGKTVAFCLPLLQKIITKSKTQEKGNQVQAIILVPTKELCTQVHQTILDLTYYCDEMINGAILSSRKPADIARQEAMLRDRPKFLVATPAGLLAQIKNGNLEGLETTVETLVVDEADLVLSFGYANDITEIMKFLPRTCQGFLMSATLSSELNTLKKVVLHSPAVLKLEEETEESKSQGKLRQFFLTVPTKDKFLVLYVFLKLGLLKGKGLFFVGTTDGGYRLKLLLEQFHIRAAVLNAELPLRSRLNIIEQFNVGNFDYLIATDESTDVGSKEAIESYSDDEEVDEEKKRKRGRKKDSGYGVSRGLDFRGVSFVVNVDFPPNGKSYTHRVGRTARGGAQGVALSLVDEKSQEEAMILEQVKEEQPRIPPILSNTGGKDSLRAEQLPDANNDTFTVQDLIQPSPLEFDLQDIEGFRYRVEDVSGKITKTVIKETRAAELRAEILNSERLQSHFAQNPADLQILRHDRTTTQASKAQDHLKHVPRYLLPKGMQVAELNKRRKRRRLRKSQNSNGQRRKDNDPLQSFDGAGADLDGIDDQGDFQQEDGFVDALDMEDGEGKDATSPKSDPMVFPNTKTGTGRSTSRRVAWKERHRKGKFSKKAQMKNRESMQKGVY